MFYFRAINNPGLLNKAKVLNELSSAFLKEMNTDNGMYSFYEVKDIKNKLSNDIVNIALLMVSISAEKWSSSIGAVFLEEKTLTPISSFSEKQLRPLKTIHRDFGKLNISQAYKLISVIFQNKNSLVRFDKATLHNAFCGLNKEDWKEIYSGRQTKSIADNICKILNSFFRSNETIPNGLNCFINDNNGICSFDSRDNCWKLEFAHQTI